MKRSSIAFVIVLLGLAAYFMWDSQFVRSLYIDLFSKDRSRLETLSLSFMEDIRFKDFDKAATYHHPSEREKSDIPKLIERMFKIKPELLDLIEYEILETSLDSSGTRGRVKMKTKVNLLNSGKIKHPEFIVYYRKTDGEWYMELASSLK